MGNPIQYHNTDNKGDFVKRLQYAPRGVLRGGLMKTFHRNFSNFFLKTTRSVISVQILVLVSMRKYILKHK